MFAGHVGVAVALGRVERRLSLGAIVLAALLLDIVLWLPVLAPPDTRTLARSSLVTILLTTGIVAWLARVPATHGSAG
jgi:hypothetical protein